VLILGNSHEPWVCAKKDERAFMSFWGKMVHCPLPDFCARRVREQAALSAVVHGCECAGMMFFWGRLVHCPLPDFNGQR
jgi:hypothetical protein